MADVAKFVKKCEENEDITTLFSIQRATLNESLSSLQQWRTRDPKRKTRRQRSALVSLCREAVTTNRR